MSGKDDKLAPPRFEDFGGETDELDAEDLAALDRGDSLIEEPKAEDKAEEPKAEEPKAEAKDDEAEEGGVGETAEAAEDTAEQPEEEPEKAAKPPAEPSIPKSRFDQVNAAKKAAEEELAALKEKLTRENQAASAAGQQEYDFDAAEERYMEAVLDGKAAEAKAIRAEIRAAERAAFEALASTKATQTTQAAKVQQEIDRIVTEAEKKYPAFDPNAGEDVFRADLVEEVSAYFGTRLQMGDAAPAAMQKAIEAVAKIHGLAAPPPAPPAKGKVATIPAGKDTTKAKVALAKQAPPPLAAVGKGSEESGMVEPDINRLTEKEWDALPESTKRRLRGDFIAA